MTRSGSLVGLGKHPIRIRRLYRAAEGPDIMRRHGIGKRSSDDITIAIAGHRRHIRFEADADMGDAIFDIGILDLRLFDRDQAIVERFASFLAIGSVDSHVGQASSRPGIESGSVDP